MFFDEFGKKKIFYMAESSSLSLQKKEIDRKANDDKKNLDKQFEILEKDINVYGKMIEQFSTFKLEDILPVISDLFTFYSGEECSYYVKGSKGYVILPELNQVFDLLDFVGEQKFFEKLDFVSYLIANDLIIDFSSKRKGEIRFYNYNSYTKTLKYFREETFRQYTSDEMFIKDFIDFVIEYRISNKARFLY